MMPLDTTSRATATKNSLLRLRAWPNAWPTSVLPIDYLSFCGVTSLSSPVDKS